MKPTIAKLAKFILLAASWILILFGILGCGVTLPVAYLLLSEQVSPGQRYFMDEIAPTTGEAIMDVLFFAMFLVVGFVLRHLVTQRRGGSPLTDNSR